LRFTAVLINFKICDNFKDCSGIAVCPTKAFYWDRKKRTIAVDNEKCKSCGLCEESCPVDAIVETRIFEYHGENRGDLYYTKPMLLAIGDKNETQIAKDRAADAKYR